MTARDIAAEAVKAALVAFATAVGTAAAEKVKAAVAKAEETGIGQDSVIE